MAEPDLLMFEIEPHELEVEVTTSDFIEGSNSLCDSNPLCEHDYTSSPSKSPSQESNPKKKKKLNPKITNLSIIYNCKICSYSTKKKDVFIKHRKIHKNTKLKTKYLPCDDYCIQNVSQGFQNVPEGYEKCDQCGYYAKNKLSLKEHMTLHTSGRTYQCMECDYLAQDLRGFIDHYNLVEDIVCPDCYFSTHCLERFLRHQKIHE